MSWPKVVEKGSHAHRLWQVAGYGLVAAAVLWIAYRMENYQILNFANVAAYIVRNPVRAGHCRKPSQWPWTWSSFGVSDEA